jgi:hypothetical protein
MDDPTAALDMACDELSMALTGLFHDFAMALVSVCHWLRICAVLVWVPWYYTPVKGRFTVDWALLRRRLGVG